ncbi:hypothetical protein FRC03_011711, partial [Tulasnella sp. 419]
MLHSRENSYHKPHFRSRNSRAWSSEDSRKPFDPYDPDYSRSWKIDDDTSFWQTYITEAEDYDKELVDGWNKALDNLLVFSGLFSAVNTAFIIETYKSLQPDPAEDTANMFRLFLKHRNDNHQFSDEELRFGFTGTPRTAIRTNSIFFASLSCSLLVAIGAVQGKDWLTQYDHSGLAAKPPSLQARVRQEKFDGLERWRFRLFIALLPLLLQISLALFLAGVIAFLWEISNEVASVVITITTLGFIGYLASWVIAVFYSTSPFQTPLSAPLRRPFIGFLALVRWIAHRTGASIIRMLPLRLLRFQSFLRSWYDKNSFILWGSRNLQTAVVTVVTWLKSFKEESENKISELIVERDLNDQTSAECVGWLFEQAEQPAVVLRTLSVSSLLPPDYVLAAFNRRPGLLERLAALYDSCVQEPVGKETSISKPGEAIITGIALFHALKAQLLTGFDGFRLELSAHRMRSIKKTTNESHNQNKTSRPVEGVEVQEPQSYTQAEGGQDPDVLDSQKTEQLDQLQVLAMVICCVEMVLPKSNGAEAIPFKECLAYIPPLFKLSITVDVSPFHSCPVFPFGLLLDAVIASGIRHIRDPEWRQDWFTRYEIKKFLRCLKSVLEKEQPSHEMISHIAITVAVVQLSRLSARQHDEVIVERCLKHILEAWYVVDKRATVFKSIVIAFTVVTEIKPDDEEMDLYLTLLRFLNYYLPKDMEVSKGSEWKTWWPHAMKLYPGVIDFLDRVKPENPPRHEVLRIFARLLPDDWQYEDIKRAFITGYTKEKYPQLHVLSPDPRDLYTNRNYCERIIDIILQSFQQEHSDGFKIPDPEVQDSVVEILGWIVAYTYDQTHLPAQISKQTAYTNVPQFLISILKKYDAPRIERRNNRNAMICRHATRHLLALAEIESVHEVAEEVKLESLLSILGHGKLISRWSVDGKVDPMHGHFIEGLIDLATIPLHRFFGTEADAEEKAQDIGDSMLKEIMRVWREARRRRTPPVPQLFYRERAIKGIMEYVTSNQGTSARLISSEPFTILTVLEWMDEARTNILPVSPDLAQELAKNSESLR